MLHRLWQKLQKTMASAERCLTDRIGTTRVRRNSITTRNQQHHVAYRLLHLSLAILHGQHQLATLYGQTILGRDRQPLIQSILLVLTNSNLQHISHCRLPIASVCGTHCSNKWAQCIYLGWLGKVTRF